MFYENFRVCSVYRPPKFTTPIYPGAGDLLPTFTIVSSRDDNQTCCSSSSVSNLLTFLLQLNISVANFSIVGKI